MSDEMLDIAIAAHNAGLCVLPPKQDGSKRPLKAWEKYANTSSTIEEVEQWYLKPDRTGMGLVLGAASNGVECFEFDDLTAYYAFHDLAEQSGLGDLVERIEKGYLEESPNGIHWLYRCEEVTGNTKLANRPESDGVVKTLIETRGQGGFAIVAPSHGDVHPSGKAYRLLSGGFDKIATITPEERQSLWNLARSMDEMPRSLPSPKKEPGNQVSVSDSPVGERPGDWFNRVANWSDILEPAGWTWVFDKGVESYWRRPGKDRDYSGTTNYEGNDVLKVFSSSTPFDPDKSYTKFAAFAVLKHNGDFGAAARAIFPEMPKESRHLEVLDGGGADGDQPLTDTDAPRLGDSWKPADLTGALTGEISLLNLPAMLAREDDTLLLYPSRLHEFKGLPEAGKGWLALIACKQELRAGNTVVYIDLEDHAEGIVERLLALGVSHEAINTRFVYVHPEEEFGETARKVFFEMIREREPSLAILDSVAEIMASNGLDPLSNKDAATFINMLPRPLTLCGPDRHGPAVVVIDHLTKQNDNTRFSIGAQHKLAAVDGASYVVEAEEPFGRGRKGSSRIAVVKDRPGHVRRHAEGGRYIGRLIVHANENGTSVDAQLARPMAQTIEGMEASAELLGEVAGYIESQGRRSPSTKEIREKVKGRNEAIDIALDTLARSGYIFQERRAQATVYSSIKPFEG